MTSILDLEIPLGWKLPKRRALLDQLKGQPGKYQHPLWFQNRLITLDAHAVEIDFPKYRLANGRTQAAQEEYLAKNTDIPADFFTRDSESDEAQVVQHKILATMLATPTVDLLQYFQSHVQEEPLILSNDGYVVNGNRRLCAMRLLYYGDKQKYSRFSHVDAVVLPPCDDRDIDELEACLQIQPDIKQEYTWVTKACMLRERQQRHGYSYLDLARLYDMKEKEVRETLDLLAHVDEYLEDRGKEKHYGLVEKAEFAFRQLRNRRRRIKAIDERDLFTQLSYILIDGAEVEGRLYQRIPEVQEHLPKITEELSHQLPVETAEDEPVDEYDLFGSFESPVAPVVEAVRNTENREQIIEIVQDVIEGEKQKQRDKKKATSVLDHVRRANTSLRNAINCTDSDSETEGLKEQLDSIERSVKRLKEWLAGHA